MATIQVRDVPEDVHRTYRQRAAAAGMSLQEYLRDELTRNARRRSPGDVAAEVVAQLAREGGEGFSSRSSTSIVAADRRSR